LNEREKRIQSGERILASFEVHPDEHLLIEAHAPSPESGPRCGEYPSRCAR
jgi:hypothetical protein